ncbi:MAG: FkbM family methyltransferase [Candidatus Omnitrophota bacterium]
MSKLNKALFKLIPDGLVKEEFKSLYYRFFYNKRRFKKNNFYVYYEKGHFVYEFPNGIKFKCYSDVEHELRASLWGYIKKHELRMGETVIDCGPGEGDFTLYAAKAVGSSGKVIAFEPDPLIFGELKSNIELNDLDNVILVRKGLWSENRVLKFMTARNITRSFVFSNEGGKVIEAPVVRLDDELKNLGIDKVDFIKMDVEGSELETVKGASQFLTHNKVDLAIASYHILNGEKTCFKLEKALSELGYKTDTAYAEHLTTYASKNMC